MKQGKKSQSNLWQLKYSDPYPFKCIYPICRCFLTPSLSLQKDLNESLSIYIWFRVFSHLPLKTCRYIWNKELFFSAVHKLYSVHNFRLNGGSWWTTDRQNDCLYWFAGAEGQTMMKNPSTVTGPVCRRQSTAQLSANFILCCSLGPRIILTKKTGCIYGHVWFNCWARDTQNQALLYSK